MKVNMCNKQILNALALFIITIIKQDLFSLFVSLSKLKQQTCIADYYAIVIIMSSPKKIYIKLGQSESISVCTFGPETEMF